MEAVAYTRFHERSATIGRYCFAERRKESSSRLGPSAYESPSRR
jgi:hypothetical protein